MVWERTLTYCLAADVGMPYFCIELHDWGPERVVVGYLDVDRIRAPLIRCTRRTLEGALEMRQIISIPYWICLYV